MQLKILAGNISGGKMSGSLCMNGQPFMKKQIRQCSTIVWQRDLLLATATVRSLETSSTACCCRAAVPCLGDVQVREALMTSAELRLPQSMSRACKQARVEEVLNELELQGVADTLIRQERDAAMTGACECLPQCCMPHDSWLMCCMA